MNLKKVGSVLELTSQEFVVSQARIQDFGQGGQWSFDPKGGALSPKFAQNKIA